MTVVQDNVSKLLSTLAHPLRREILSYIGKNGEQRFTDLMNALNIDTGKMSFHMRHLQELLDQDPTGKYRLNKAGERALELIGDVEDWAFKGELEPVTTIFSTANFIERTIAFFIDASLIFIVFMLPTLVTDVFLAGMANGITINFNIFVFLVVLWLYFTLFEGFAGQSFGKLVMRSKVVRINGKEMSYDNAAIRNLGKCFLLPLDLLMGYRIRKKGFLRYFDKFSGTTVVNLNSRQQIS